MDRRQKKYTAAEQEIADAFIAMSSKLPIVCKSPRTKDAQSKDESLYLPSEEENISSDEEVVPKQLTTGLPVSSSIFIDSRLNLDFSIPKIKSWLTQAHLFDFATLPWEDWKGNSKALEQFRFIQLNNGFLYPGVYLSVELVSHVFRLPMEGEKRFERSPINALEQDFGVPESSQGYYVVKKAKDPIRK